MNILQSTRALTVRDHLQYVFGTTWESGAEFERAWEEFASRSDHTVKRIEPPLPSHHRWLISNMNCFAYTLGLEKLPAYHRWVREHCALEHLDGQFMDELIEQKWLREIVGDKAPASSLVVYQDGDQITHCGLVFTEHGRVRSKFNVYEFYEHGLLEVQSSFGVPTKYCELPSDEVRERIVRELDARAKE